MLSPSGPYQVEKKNPGGEKWEWIISGIAEFFEPEKIIGKQVITIQENAKISTVIILTSASEKGRTNANDINIPSIMRSLGDLMS